MLAVDLHVAQREAVGGEQPGEAYPLALGPSVVQLVGAQREELLLAVVAEQREGRGIRIEDASTGRREQQPVAVLLEERPVLVLALAQHLLVLLALLDFVREHRHDLRARLEERLLRAPTLVVAEPGEKRALRAHRRDDQRDHAGNEDRQVFEKLEVERHEGLHHERDRAE